MSTTGPREPGTSTCIARSYGREGMRVLFATVKDPGAAPPDVHRDKVFDQNIREGMARYITRKQVAIMQLMYPEHRPNQLSVERVETVKLREDPALGQVMITDVVLVVGLTRESRDTHKSSVVSLAASGYVEDERALMDLLRSEAVAY